MTTAAAGLGGLIARAAPFTSYRTYTYNTDPNVPGIQGLATVAEATELVRAHVAADSRLRSTAATPYGAVILHQGDTHIRLEPGIDARPQRLTGRQADDLLLIGRVQDRAKVVWEPAKGWATVQGGVWRIPAVSTERLVRRGWIATEGADGALVTVSLAGVVALQWRYLKGERVSSTARWAEDVAEHVVDVFSS
jgi:hypothetical protein